MLRYLEIMASNARLCIIINSNLFERQKKKMCDSCVEEVYTRTAVLVILVSPCYVSPFTCPCRVHWSEAWKKRSWICVLPHLCGRWESHHHLSGKNSSHVESLIRTEILHLTLWWLCMVAR